MDETTMGILLQMGFSYEDLYKKGFLVLKPTEEAEIVQTAEIIELDQDSAVVQPDETQQEPSTQDAFEEMFKAFDDFKSEIRTMIQTQNRADTVRKEEPKQITLDEAVQGLFRGEK